MQSVSERIKQLKIIIPKVEPRFLYLPGVLVDDILFVSGQTPEVNGKMQYAGVVGETIDVETAKKAARLAALNCLGEAEAVLGNLDKIERIVRVIGYVRSAKGFGEQPLVMNGASELLIEIFGERGKHARAALGVSELPFGACVEMEMIMKIRRE